MDKLLHWVLLNTPVRKQVEAALDMSITHSTGTCHPQPTDMCTAGLPEEAKVARQLSAMNLMERLGHTPELGVWREPGTLMEGTYKVEVNDQGGQVRVAGRGDLTH
jgi:hypothetical protein